MRGASVRASFLSAVCKDVSAISAGKLSWFFTPDIPSVCAGLLAASSAEAALSPLLVVCQGGGRPGGGDAGSVLSVAMLGVATACETWPCTAGALLSKTNVRASSALPGFASS